MHVLITGGAGFIGSYLVEYHLKNNDVVYVLDDLSTGCIENIAPFKDHPHFVFIQANILMYPEIEEIAAWADWIYHFAAAVGVLNVIHDPYHVLAVNIDGTHRLLRAIRSSTKKPRVMIASTSEVYGSCDLKTSREDAPLMLGMGKKSCATYMLSKMAQEAYAQAYYQQFDIPVTIMRIFNTIGPRQIGTYGMVVPRFIEQALNNHPITVYGDGTQTRSFCDVRDLIIMLHQIMKNTATIGEIINIGQDQEISINALAHLIQQITHSTSKIQHISYVEAYGENFEDYMARRPNLEKLKRLIQPSYQWSLQRTLEEIISHDPRLST